MPAIKSCGHVQLTTEAYGQERHYVLQSVHITGALEHHVEVEDHLVTCLENADARRPHIFFRCRLLVLVFAWALARETSEPPSRRKSRLLSTAGRETRSAAATLEPTPRETGPAATALEAAPRETGPAAT